jgi:hypothetical protein
MDNEDASPFRLYDVHLLIHDQRLNHVTCAEEDLPRVTYVTLEFTNQKNGVHGELVGLEKLGHPLWCPVNALRNRIFWHKVDTATLTRHLRHATMAMGQSYGILPQEILVRSLHASGTMSLLCARVDTNMIRLMGRWRLDEMLRYLHVQSFPLLASLASQMLRHGCYTMMPNLPL